MVTNGRLWRPLCRSGIIFARFWSLTPRLFLEIRHEGLQRIDRGDLLDEVAERPL